jgi:hypothetical protein
MELPLRLGTIMAGKLGLPKRADATLCAAPRIMYSLYFESWPIRMGAGVIVNLLNKVLDRVLLERR